MLLLALGEVRESRDPAAEGGHATGITTLSRGVLVVTSFLVFGCRRKTLD